jgi:hypothetical protein
MEQPPEGAQLSDDGNYWWDEGAGEWKLVADASSHQHSDTPPGTLSDDGYYRWDGNEWVPATDAAFPAAVDVPMDWAAFPEIGRVLHYGEDVDAYLTDLGVDPDIMNDDDEPMA